MTTPAITTLKLRKLKPCVRNVTLLNTLPQSPELWNRMIKFDVKIPTKLWQFILRRRNRECPYLQRLELPLALNEGDIHVERYNTAEGSLIPDVAVHYFLPKAVYVKPVDKELFYRFNIRVRRILVEFISPTDIEFSIILRVMRDFNIEAVFDVSHFPAPVEKPSGPLVSYIINS